MPTVRVTINGQSLEAPVGVTVLEAARQAAIDIPTLCEHPALSSIGACRMCVIEVGGQRALQTACTYPVSEGMVVETESVRVVNARKLVLDLIFSERNHFCMYCEASGECELQRLGYRYNLKNWAYPTYTKPFAVDASHRFYLMEHNRCVLCWRCIRGCDELAANHTLGLGKRGARTVINADLDSPLGQSSCISCGTCVQLCPTGALFDKRSAFMCKDDMTERVKSTCSHCSVGCGIEILSRFGNVVRILGDWEAPVNRGVLCRYGRFEPLYNERERVTVPLVRRHGRLEQADWGAALQEAAARLKGATGGGLGALISSRCTNEALYLASLLFGDRLKAAALGLLNPVAASGLGRKALLGEIAASDLIIVAGADPVAHQPVASFFIKRAVDQGRKLVVVDDGANALEAFAPMSFPMAEVEKAVALARRADNPLVLYGPKLPARAAEMLKSLGDKASFLALEEGVNTNYAASLGLNANFGPRAVRVLYVLAADEQEIGDQSGIDENTFIIAQASYKSPWGERADIVLPSAIWSEQSGTLTNTEGRVQRMSKAVEPAGEARADWEVLTLLAEQLGLSIGGAEEIFARASGLNK